MPNSDMKQIRANIRTITNTKAIRRERRGGRDKIIVPSATLPDNVVMNGILYPAHEIAKGFHTLNMSPAPLGHPTGEGGVFISALHPDGINAGWIGAHNENVRQEGGRVLLDKVIDVAFAQQNVGGRAVLEAIEKGGPIHTSTGLYFMAEPVTDTALNYTMIAHDMAFDHDAILLGEEGAATPEQGVGMMVNAAGENTEIQVINSSWQDEVDDQLNWAVESMVRALDKQAKAPLIERMKAAMLEAFQGFPGRANPAQIEGNADMDKVQFDALSAEVKTLSDGMKTIDTTVATAVNTAVTEALKPLIEAQAQAAANAAAAQKAELEGYVATIVANKTLTEDVAKTLSLEAAKSLATANANDKTTPALAYGLNAGGFKPKGDEKAAFKLPEGEKA